MKLSAVSKVSLRWISVLGWMMVIFSSSSVPGTNIPSVFPYQDIVYHFLSYLILGFLVKRAVCPTFRSETKGKIFLFTVVFCIFYAIIDELHQSFVPYRTCSLFDVSIDSAGIIIGAFLHNDHHKTV